MDSYGSDQIFSSFEDETNQKFYLWRNCEHACVLSASTLKEFVNSHTEKNNIFH